MRATARQSAEYPDYYTYENSDFSRWELTPGERVCPPPYHPSRKARLLKVFVFLLAIGAGWMALRDKVDWQQLPSRMASLMTSFRETLPAELKPSAETADPTADTAAAEIGSQTVSSDQKLELAAAPPDQPTPDGRPTGVEAQQSTQQRETLEQASVPVTTINSAPAAEEAQEEGDAPASRTGEEPVEPLPPAEPDPADSYQMRAAAVGLHPGLSRVLLERLTPTDYRNAEIAIKTALAKTPNGSEYVWPRQRRPELALFKVHFVKGAAPGCRRYVVTIIKDGWSTTALPMENCEARGQRSERRVSSLPRR